MKNAALFRDRLNKKKMLFGSAITLKDTMVTEILAKNAEFFFIDMEHGGLTIENIEKHLQVARGFGVPAITRIPFCAMEYAKMVLDAGTDGVIVPQIYTGEDVKIAVSACRYPPAGRRGYGPRIPSNFGQYSGKDYIERANQEIFLAIQIETKEAYENLDEILKINGWNSAFIGPCDLACSLGYYGDIENKHVLEAIKTISNKVKASGRSVGFGMGVYAGGGKGVDIDYVQRLVEIGVDWLQIGGDVDYLVSMSDMLYSRLQERYRQ
jgi:2-keto-3-deoxy-L-rhamnonate aldolase RhmA